MKAFILVLLLLCSWVYQLNGQIPFHPNKVDQKKRKQGPWTILYDQDWKLVQDTAQAEYYRIVTYKNGQLVGMVTDYYKNGVKQFTARLLADEPKDIIDGTASWYNPDGSLKYQAVYKKGKREGDLKLYDKDGTLITKSWREINSRGIQLNKSGNYEAALKEFEKGYIVASFQFQADSPTYLDAVNNLAALCSKNGLYERAEQLYMEALGIYATLPEEQVAYANGLKNLGLLYHDMGLYKETEMLYKEVLTIRKKELGTTHPDYAAALNNLGSVSHEMGKYQSAEELFLESKSLYQSTFSKDNIDYAILINNLASLYQDMGRLTDALAMYEEAAEILKRKSGTENTDYMTCFSNVASIHRELGHYAQSEAIFLEVKAMRERMLGVNHAEYASALNQLAILYKTMGQYAKAEPLYLQAKEIWKRTLGETNTQYASALSNLASLYESMGLFAKAEPYHFEAMEIRKKVLGVEHPNYAMSLNNIGLYYKTTGNYSMAEKYYLEAMAIRLKILGRESSAYAISLNNLAFLYREMGNFKKSEDMFLESLKIKEAIYGKDHPEYALVLANLGELYSDLADYPKAEPLFLQAKEIRLKTLGREHPLYASTLNEIAGLYEDMGNIDKAEPLYHEAAEIRAITLGKEHPNYAGSLNNLGKLSRKKGEYEQAENYYMAALEIKEKTLGKEHPEYINSVNNLATLYTYRKDYKKAIPLFLQTKEFALKKFGSHHPDYALALGNLASTYFQAGEMKAAENFFLESAAVYAEAYGKTHPDYMGAIFNLAELYREMGDIKKAITLYRESVTAKLNEIARYFPSLSENEKKIYLNSTLYYFSNFEEFAVSQNKSEPSLMADLFNLRLATKGILFHTSNKIRDRIFKSGDQTIVALYNQWQAMSDWRSKAFQMTAEEKKNNGVDEVKLEEELNSLEKELSLKSEIFKLSDEGDKKIWQDVKQKLRPYEVAVEMVRTYKLLGKEYVPVYVALIVKPQISSYPEVIILENGTDLENRLNKFYRNSIKQKTKDEISYNQYWKPIADKIKGFKKIYFSADGVYNQLNLNTLFNPATGKYVIDEWEVQVVTSTKDLLIKTQGINSPIRQATLFGYPNYNSLPSSSPDSTRALSNGEITKISEIKSDKEQRFLNGENINELPGTKTEVETIGAMLRKRNITTYAYTFNEATETEIKRLSNPQVLHIATHGFFLSDLSTTQENERGFAGMETRKIMENPLLRSGLLFAGVKNAFANRTIDQLDDLTLGEDGLLTAYEAMGLDLDQTDLVVMSACETGLGVTSNGEGVYGLQRAFQVAGAKSVLMSLWTVSDEATQQLMTLFYENWLAGMTAREAFRTAQLSLREKFPDPYFWGAFVLVGN